jgi:hypothetical protein
MDIELPSLITLTSFINTNLLSFYYIALGKCTSIRANRTKMLLVEFVLFIELVRLHVQRMIQSYYFSLITRIQTFHVRQYGTNMMQ